MSFAHLTLPTRHVQQTASFLERVLGYPRLQTPANSPIELVWLDVGKGQSIHIFHVENFSVSPFEEEFGRHVALFHPRSRFDAVKKLLAAEGASLFEPIRPTPFERFFFREPVNGYVFELIDSAREGMTVE